MFGNLFSSLFGKDPLDEMIDQTLTYGQSAMHIAPQNAQNYQNYQNQALQAQIQQNSYNQAYQQAQANQQQIYAMGLGQLGQSLSQAPKEEFKKDINYPIEVKIRNMPGAALGMIDTRERLRDLGVDYKIYHSQESGGDYYDIHWHVICVKTEEDANLISLTIEGVEEVYRRLR